MLWTSFASTKYINESTTNDLIYFTCLALWLLVASQINTMDVGFQIRYLSKLHGYFLSYYRFYREKLWTFMMQFNAHLSKLAMSIVYSDDQKIIWQSMLRNVWGFIFYDGVGAFSPVNFAQRQI